MEPFPGIPWHTHLRLIRNAAIQMSADAFIVILALCREAGVDQRRQVALDS